MVLLGDGDLPRAVQVALERAGARVRWLRRPTDREIVAALRAGMDVDVAMVVSRDDIEVLRLALVVEHARPGVRLIVTVFDRTVADQLRRAVPDCQVTSLADVVASTLAGPCVDSSLVSLAPAPGGELAGVREAGDRLELTPLGHTRRRGPERVRDALQHASRPFDSSARILLIGLAGFLTVLIIDTVVTGIVVGESPGVAFYGATKALVTVGPNPAVDHGPGWLKVFSAVLMLASVGFVAVLTAGIVNRLLDRRLTAIFGRRSVPRSDHVVVVGLGQVGLQLCLLIRSLGIGVVAVERNADVPGVRLARSYRIPVVIGPGAERSLLQRLRVHRARALAAITSDDVANIAIAVSALAVREDLRVILRAGDGDVTTETRSLFHIGVVRDVHRIAGDLLAAAALGVPAVGAATRGSETWLVLPDGAVEPWPGLAGEEAPLSDPDS